MGIILRFSGTGMALVACLGMVGCHDAGLSKEAFACLDKVMKLETCGKVKQEDVQVNYYPTSKGGYLLMVSKTFVFQFLVRDDEVFALNSDAADCFKVKPLYNDAEVMDKVLTEVSQIVAQKQEGKRVIITLQKK